jgi:hypothetical protein
LLGVRIKKIGDVQDCQKLMLKKKQKKNLLMYPVLMATAMCKITKGADPKYAQTILQF